MQAVNKNLIIVISLIFHEKPDVESDNNETLGLKFTLLIKT